MKEAWKVLEFDRILTTLSTCAVSAEAQAALLAGNSGDMSYLPVLEAWAQMPFEAVAEHARWAKARLLNAGLDRTDKTD